ncbi:MAG TPA: SRPBCC family protein [Acidimicrobiales bacterium]|nr:SRPBCC family protein [Acidimicrobiales bacterium]
MREHQFSFEVEATPEEVWRTLHPPMTPLPNAERRVIEHGDVRIEIVHPGDENGLGLVRFCRFRVPRYLLSGGVARSWEVITESRPPEYSRYEAVGKPLWSQATGWHRLEDLGGGRTRVSFGETYEAFNPLARRLLEARVHRFISKDNDAIIRRAVEQGLAAQRRKAMPG